MRTLLCLLLFAATVRADVTLGPVFTDHAVLQRDKTLPVWGRADAGEHVLVTLGGQAVGATADEQGRWLVLFEPMPATDTPLELKAEGKTTATATDLLLGDVWLCAGEANMERTLGQTARAEQEIATARYPLIRELKLAHAADEKPVDGPRGAWTVCEPGAAGTFSAVAYFFAREIQPRMQVPIGLINASWSSTEIECWLSPSTLAENPEFAALRERWPQLAAQRPLKKAEFEAALAAWTAEQAEAKAARAKFTKPRPVEVLLPGPSYAPGSVFNGMIHPVLPCALTGVLWYQGESNGYNGADYGALFTALIQGWRRHLGQGDLPFFWVQLANFRGRDPFGTELARVREGQAKALALPNTGQAIAIDLGERNPPFAVNLQEAGRRLALLARAGVYGARVDDSGPTFQSATREGAALRVRFEHAGTGLTAHNRPLQSFQLAGADGHFRPAMARIDKHSVVVSAKGVPEPVFIRYAFFNAPDANLYNGAGLPASPFRTDKPE